MKLLFLGYNSCKVLEYFKSKYSVFQTQEKLPNPQFVDQFEWVISYGYTHIIKEDIISRVKNPIINLHISYLPYNKGFYPNFWSFKDNTPKGVTIHHIDKGIDTGDILIQKLVNFSSEEDNLEKTYNRLREEIEKLMINNWESIIQGKIQPTTQVGEGTYHFKKELNNYKYLLTKGWNTKIKKIMKIKKRTDLEIIDEVENVRTKNNVNWMDILRLAFKHAPEDARILMGRVNEYDGRISELLKELSNNGK